MLRFEWLPCCHCPVCIYFTFAVLRLNKPHLQRSGNADKRRGWNNRGCGRGSHTCSRALFVSCCTSGATNHRSNLAWIWHQMFLRIPRQMSIWQLFIQILFITINWLFHRPVSSNASVPLKGRNLPSGSSTTCDSGTGWSAGQLKDILWSVNLFQEDEAKCMPADYSRVINCTSFVVCILASGGWREWWNGRIAGRRMRC